MRRVLHARLLSLVVLAMLAAVLPMAASASAAPALGTATSFAVLAGTTITNTGLTVITGDLGVSPGTAVTGFPPGIVIGTIHAGDAQAQQAQTDLATAYGVAASSPCNVDMSGQDLGGQILTPGTYCFSSSAQLTGTLTLNGNGVYIFQIGSTLTTAPGATVSPMGAQPCNVFWQVGSSATLDTTTTFVGTIMALTSISLKDSAHIAGRALARNGAVTLMNNKITAPTSCNAVTVPGPTASPSASPTASPTASPSASPTASPSSSPTASPSSSPTASPASSPTASPTPTPVPLLPNTGGGPQNGVPWMLVLIAGLGTVGLGLSVRARRRRV